MSSKIIRKNKNNNSNHNSNHNSNNNSNCKVKTKQTYEHFDIPKVASSKPENGSFSDVIDILSVSPSQSDPSALTWEDQLQDYFIIFLKYGFLVSILTLNFLGLSVSLNCNADQEVFRRVLSAIFAFFFGFVYLLVNYYTYKVLSQGKICKMNRDKLFPFKI